MAPIKGVSFSRMTITSIHQPHSVAALVRSQLHALGGPASSAGDFHLPGCVVKPRPEQKHGQPEGRC
jgi:hypothetical protein